MRNHKVLYLFILFILWLKEWGIKPFGSLPSAFHLVISVLYMMLGFYWFRKNPLSTFNRYGKKAYSLIKPTVDGMVSVVNFLHPEKECSPIDSSPDSIFNVSRLLHPSNALFEMFFKLDGMEIAYKEKHHLNAHFPIDSVPFGTIYDPARPSGYLRRMLSLLKRTPSISLKYKLLLTLISLRFAHPKNALVSITITLDEIVILEIK